MDNDMDNELERRLTRMEKGIDAIREEIERQALQLRRNHGLIVEFIDILTQTEAAEEAPLAALLERLVGRLEHVADVSGQSLAALDKIARQVADMHETSSGPPPAKLTDPGSR